MLPASRKRPSPLAITTRTWARGNGPGMVVVVGAVVVVAAVVVVGAAVVVDSGNVEVAAIVVVVAASEVDVVDATSVVDEDCSLPVLLESSTNGSLGTGRPAMATPARPPTTITARANGHDLRMRKSS